MQIIILGMHRSGTSTVTRLVNLMGAFVGDEAELIGANEENPKGFWERRDVIAVNDALLAEHDCRWYDLSRWPYAGHERITPPPAQAAEMTRIVARLDAHGDWALKDPRLCHTLPYWWSLLKDPFFVIVHRDPLAIARSLATRNACTVPQGMALWECAAVGILNAIDRARTVFLSYDTVLAEPLGSTQRLCAALNAAGAQLDCPPESVISDFIEPGLNRSRPEGLNKDDYFTVYQSRLMAAFEGHAAPTGPLSISGHARAVLGASAQAQAIQAEKAEAEIALSQLRLQHEQLQAQCHAIQHSFEELVAYNATLAAAKAERDAMLNTRWWRLRQWLLSLRG